ncbi:related to COG3602 family protein [Rhynchosporium agropyri]|uniref:Related to COG3602 family protein n=1 Tax=Rhynchosporium agropyri TaxID=914238 RepID=A0A1E1KPZ3_9HELO|nr:related to COG3602 family protein [Rhynchosporium agropyri]
METHAPAPKVGETNLAALLATLKTSLHPDIFVFITLPNGQSPPPSLFLQMLFREAEGMTVITTQDSAVAHGLEYSFPSRMITLDIHSSLEAVGFIAAVSAKLTAMGVGVNPISAFFHDHCFVPLGSEREAVSALEDLARDSK